MKRILLLILVCLSLTVFSQTNDTIKKAAQPKGFGGTSTGINNKSGMLGVHGNLGVTNKFMLGAAIGLGGWGTKISINGQYHPKGYYKHYFLAGFSRAGGLDEFEMELETEENDTQELELKLNPVYNLNIAAGYNWRLGKKARFFLEGGFAIRVASGEAYKQLETNYELTDEAETVMNILTPGGLRFALGFDFAIN